MLWKEKMAIVFGTITDKEDTGIVDAPTFIRYAQMIGTLRAPPLTEDSTPKITPNKGEAVTGA